MGARVLDGGRVRFRVYAPGARSVDVEIYPWPGGIIDRHPMEHDGGGLWCTEFAVPLGTLYRYRPDETWGYPDPYSRSQPEGVHGPSQVVDPAFAWSDADWQGLDPASLVIYELHVGAYTPEGTFDAVISQLDALHDLGINAIELMPVCEFPGKRNWGYDGAHRFAPASVYGGPDGLRRLVDAAHARGLGVVLDVVYNHLGPDGDYLHMFVPNVLTDRYQTPWGKAINFDGEDSEFVRQYFIDNVMYWMHEFRVDGLRLDAAHEMYDRKETHILRDLATVVHERAPAGRRCVIVAEHERHEVRVITSPDAGGYGLDAMWVDDFHHSIYVRLTGEHEGYYNAYQGTTEELARIVNDGLLYCDLVGLNPETDAGRSVSRALVYCLQNHDQIGNRHFGTRMTEIAGIELYKAAYALLLLVEETPLMFMGDEYAAATPFLYFTDHTPELAALTAAGREGAFGVFWAARGVDSRQAPDAQAESTFLISKLDPSERERPPHDGASRLFRELIALRRNDVAFRTGDGLSPRAEAVSDGVLAVERGLGDDRRLVAVNFGDAVSFAREGAWKPVLSTAEARFAGPGVDLLSLRIESEVPVWLPAKSTTVWTADSAQV
jgi:maltooligosyltrehalose trehalohydrolase